MRTASIALLLLCALPAAAVAQTAQSAQTAPAAPPPPPAPGPSLSDALLAAQSAIAACRERQQNVSVAVVDAAGVHKLLLAADGAHSRGVQSSTAKALTSLAFNAASGSLAERAKQDVALAARLSANAAYNSRAGGLPIVKDGALIGAIGVGGARGSENDEACARAGLERIGVRTARLAPAPAVDPPSEPAAQRGIDRLARHLP